MPLQSQDHLRKMLVACRSSVFLFSLVSNEQKVIEQPVKTFTKHVISSGAFPRMSHRSLIKRWQFRCAPVASGKSRNITYFVTGLEVLMNLSNTFLLCYLIGEDCGYNAFQVWFRLTCVCPCCHQGLSTK